LPGCSLHRPRWCGRSLAWVSAADSHRLRVRVHQPRTGARATALAEPTAGSDEVLRYMPPAKRLPGIGALAVMRAVSLLVWLYATGCVFFPMAAISWVYDRLRDPVRRRLVDFVIRTWARAVALPFFKVKVEGVENLPPPGDNCVFVANHASFMDILSVLHVPRSLKYISKASIFKIPIIGWTMKAADHIGLERMDRRSQVEVFRKSVKKLQDGSSLFIFPEGTRSKDSKMLDFKAKGAFAMAKRSKAPLLPMTILGTGRIMPGGKEYLLYPGGSGVKVVIHKLIPAEEVQGMDDAELVAQARAAVQSGLPEAYRGDP